METACGETIEKQPPNGSNTLMTIEERNLTIYRRHVIDGRSFRELGEEYSLSSSTCWEAVRKAESKLSDQFHREIKDFRTRQTMMLESMIGELYEAWHKSKQPLEIDKTGTTLKGKPVEEHTIKHTGPDPRYLDSAARLLADIRAMWGVDAPKASTVEITGQGVPTVEIIVGSRDEAVEFTRLVEAKATLIEADTNQPNSVALQPEAVTAPAERK